MITEERVWSYLVEANPIPDVNAHAAKQDDVTAHLATPTKRSSDMSQLDTKAVSEKSEKTGTKWLVAAAAALVILIGLGSWFVLEQNQDDAASQPPEITAVLDAIDAFNAGDVDRYVAAFNPTAEDVQASREGHFFFEVRMNANDHIEVVEPCQLTTTAPAVVECTITSVNDFYGPAGISSTAVAQIHLDDELRITEFNDTLYDSEAPGAFNTAFNTWLLQTHTDIFDQIQPVDLGAPPGLFRDPAVMAIAIQYVEEFVAQSDDYPITQDSP